MSSDRPRKETKDAISEFLMSSKGTITLEEARKRHAKRWPSKGSTRLKTTKKTSLAKEVKRMRRFAKMNLKEDAKLFKELAKK